MNEDYSIEVQNLRNETNKVIIQMNDKLRDEPDVKDLMELLVITILNYHDSNSVHSALENLSFSIQPLHHELLFKILYQNLTSSYIIPFLNVFASLHISNENLDDIHNHVLNILSSAELNQLPIMIRFLLQTIDSSKSRRILIKFRKNLDFENIYRTSSGDQTTLYPETLIIDLLSIIQEVKNQNEFLQFDIITLILITSISPANRRKSLNLLQELLIRNLISVELLLDTLRLHTKGLREYIKDILSIGDEFLRNSYNSGDNLAETFKGINEVIFNDGDTWHKQEIIGNLVTHIGSGIENEIESLISELTIFIRKQLTSHNEKYKRIGVVAALSMIQRLGAVLESRTEIINQSVEMLEMILRYCKQSAVRKREILSLFKNKSDEYLKLLEFQDLSRMRSTQEKSSSSQSWLPNSYLKIEKWMRLNEECSDEVDNSVNIFPLVTNAFSNSTHGIYEIGSTSSSASNNNVITWFNNAHFVSLLPSIFRLYQTLQKHDNDDLEDIDSILGASVVMFKNLDLSTLKATNGKEIKESMCSALFIAINWFRELINAFCYDLKNEDFVRKIMQRLRNIIILEKQLIELAESMHRWIPIGLTEDDLSALKLGGSTAKLVQHPSEKDDIDEEPLNQNHRNAKSNGLLGNNEKKKKFKGKAKISTEIGRFSSVGELRSIFREFEVNLFLLLELDIVDEENESENFEKLEFSTLKYLLEDLHLKIVEKFSLTKKNHKTSNSLSGSGFYSLNRISTSVFIEKVIILIPSMCKIFEKLFNQLSDLSADVTNKKLRKECFELLLKCFEVMLNWNGFKMEARHQLNLKATLQIFSNRYIMKKKRNNGDNNEADDTGDDQKQETRTEDQILNSFHYFSMFIVKKQNDMEETLNLANNLILLRLMDTITTFFDPHFITLKNFTSDDVIEDIEEIRKLYYMKSKLKLCAEAFLKQNWEDKKKSDQLSYLLQKFIGNIPEDEKKLDMIRYHVNTVLKSYAVGNEEVLRKNPFLFKDNFAVYYKILFVELNNVSVNLKVEENNENHLELMEQIVKTFVNLIDLIKIQSVNKLILNVALKKGKSFIDIFLKVLFPILKKNFKHFKDKSTTVLKACQIGTRILQTACNESKVARDTNLLSSVPGLKKSLEMLLYQVKIMLADQGFSSAWFMGNLKHKNLAGEAISSQIPNESEESEDSNDGSQSDDGVNDAYQNRENSDVQSRTEKEIEEDAEEVEHEENLPKKRKISTSAKSKERDIHSPNKAQLGYSSSGRKLSNSQINSSDDDEVNNDKQIVNDSSDSKEDNNISVIKAQLDTISQVITPASQTPVDSTISAPQPILPTSVETSIISIPASVETSFISIPTSSITAPINPPSSACIIGGKPNPSGFMFNFPINTDLSFYFAGTPFFISWSYDTSLPFSAPKNRIVLQYQKASLITTDSKWITINDTLRPNALFYNWTIPETGSGLFKLKIYGDEYSKEGTDVCFPQNFPAPSISPPFKISNVKSIIATTDKFPPNADARELLTLATNDGSTSSVSDLLAAVVSIE
ncbi:Fanconi anemia group D2 protein [Clydaea vesicula]|uniref:Fanconi anemia group D2 protein n=1 Tax=Clydaea vesicula TaxID=447962 RepID=A0AAD5UA24_9FUNG|nr:Fanconi anemia group D2 protein [Clydaea vesicula]